jgi:hypothetical protein
MPMPFCFRHCIRLAPGIRLNIGKSRVVLGRLAAALMREAFREAGPSVHLQQQISDPLSRNDLLPVSDRHGRKLAVVGHPACIEQRLNPVVRSSATPVDARTFFLVTQRV